MFKEVYLAIIFLFVSSCSRRPEINCLEDNLPKLSEAGESFIRDNLSVDKETQTVQLSDFNVLNDSCYVVRAQEKVHYKLQAVGTDDGKVKRVSFSCFVQKNQKEIKTLCQMI